MKVANYANPTHTNRLAITTVSEREFKVAAAIWLQDSNAFLQPLTVSNLQITSHRHHYRFSQENRLATP